MPLCLRYGLCSTVYYKLTLYCIQCDQVKLPCNRCLSVYFNLFLKLFPLNVGQECSSSLRPSACISEDDEDLTRRGTLTWDDALRKSTQEFQHHSYSLFTCNCHCFVANSLNRLGFHSGGWNVVNLATLMFIRGHWVSTGSIVRSYLPFVVVCGLGLIFGGSTFLTFLAFFTFFLVGWFLLGSYCFKNLIQL